MNPKSMFAKRQNANFVITEAFRGAGPDSGKAAYQRLKVEYGPAMVPEEMLNDIGYRLLGAGKNEAAVAAFELNVAEHPESGNAYDSMGEAFETTGDQKRAIAAYEKSLELDPTNDHARQKLAELKAAPEKEVASGLHALTPDFVSGPTRSSPSWGGRNGEVYRARDTRQREVAVKVLPATVGTMTSSGSVPSRGPRSPTQPPNIEMVLDLSEVRTGSITSCSVRAGRRWPRVARGRVPEREAAEIGAQAAEPWPKPRRGVPTAT
jgi:hypothetical protein